MVPRAYDTVRNLINDFGYSSPEEVTERLRAALLPPDDTTPLRSALEWIAKAAEQQSDPVLALKPEAALRRAGEKARAALAGSAKP